jgi:hypothetical protein
VGRLTRTERAAAQEHCLDLCRLVGQQTPNEAEPTGDFCALEKGTARTSGGEGWANVWEGCMRGHRWRTDREGNLVLLWPRRSRRVD